MNISVDFRPLLAATVLLTVLAAVYEYAAETISRAVPAATAGAGVKHPTVAMAPVAQAPYAVASPTAVAPVEVASPCPALPLRFKALKTGPAFRHYVGTVGGEPASAELSWVRPDSAVGRCYLWRGGLEREDN